MKSRIIPNSKLFKLPYLKQFDAICIGGFIFIKAPSISQELETHEMIHQRQMDQHGVLKFYALYAYYFVRNYLKLRNVDQAYREIPFEKEAYGDKA